MSQVGFLNIDAAMRKLQQHQLLVRGSIADTKRRIVRHVLTDLVKNSPQWSGNLASQWFVETNGNMGSYSPISGYDPIDWNKGTHYQMGMQPAVNTTLARELPKVDKIRYNSKVRIVNYAPYASDVEQGIGPNGKPIRDVNKLASYGAVAMAGYVSQKYNNIRFLRKLAE